MMSKRKSPLLVERAILPEAVSARLLAESDAIASRMARRIATEVAVPGGPLPAANMRSIIAACRDALRVLVRRLHDGRGPRSGDLDRLALMGARQADSDVPLDVLLGAYRVAAKVVWEEVVGAVARDQAMSPETLVGVASQIFEYLDEISGAVGSAYLERRERLNRQRDRERDMILQRLVAGDDSREVHRAAVVHGLDLEPPYLLLAAAAPDDVVDVLIDRVWRPAGILVVGETPGVWLLLADPGLDVEELCTASRLISPDVVFGIGTTATTLADVAGAARRARIALAVGRRLEPGMPIHHEARVGVFAAMDTDRETMARFVEAILGSIVNAPTNRSRELMVTLEAVLSTSGLSDAAERLAVHRHTVVYRLQRLHELGIDPGDPAKRHLLWLAITLRRLLETSEP